MLKISVLGFLETEPTLNFENWKLGFCGSVNTRCSLHYFWYHMQSKRWLPQTPV